MLNWWNVLSGFIGVLIGSAITSCVSLSIFKKQIRIDSNRQFILQLITELQRIYISVTSRKEISEDTLNFLEALRAVSFKECQILSPELVELNKLLINYRKSRDESLRSTQISIEESHNKEEILQNIQAIMRKIHKLT